MLRPQVSGTVPLRVPGLSPEFVAYVASHNSNAYDCMALTAFAEGLQVAGYVDRAAHLYYRYVCHVCHVCQACNVADVCIYRPEDSRFAMARRGTGL